MDKSGSRVNVQVFLPQFKKLFRPYDEANSTALILLRPSVSVRQKCCRDSPLGLKGSLDLTGALYLTTSYQP
jgi:hypothetical protein